MSDNEVPKMASRRNRRLGWGAGMLAAGALGGAVLAGALPASAATSTPSTPSTSGSSSASSTSPEGAPSGQPPASGMTGGPRGANSPGGQRPDEKVLTGALAAQVKAAALKAVPGGTVYRVETDADGATYEAHMKKADGTLVTVKFDKNVAVTAIQAGMGAMKKPATTSGPA